jgi:hypothetical protein
VLQQLLSRARILSPPVQKRLATRLLRCRKFLAC